MHPSLAPHPFTARDGAGLVYRELGPADGRPLLLLHGYLSTGVGTWISPGHAGRLAEAGHRVIVPDLRAHGESARPRDASAYPPDILADDALDLVAALGLHDLDVGGYSLGGRIATRLLVRGLRARRAVIAGVGLDDLLASQNRTPFFLRVFAEAGTFAPGTPEAMTEDYLRATKGDPQALVHLLPTVVDLSRGDIAAITSPALVALGDADLRNANDLVALLPDATFLPLRGDHYRSILRPELGAAMVEFLA